MSKANLLLGRYPINIFRMSKLWLQWRNQLARGTYKTERANCS